MAQLQLKSNTEILRNAYKLENALLESSFTNTTARSREINGLVMHFAKEMYSVDSAKGLQEAINSKLPARDRIREDGVVGKNTVIAFFKVLHRDALLNGGVSEEHANALKQLRRAIYPYLNEKSATMALAKGKKELLAMFGHASTLELQTMLMNEKVVDYSGRAIKGDGIMGKRTLYAAISNYEGNSDKVRAVPDTLGTVPKRLAAEVMYLNTGDVNGLDITQSEKEKILNTLGVKYTFGGSSIERGFDCSGLVEYLFAGERREYTDEKGRKRIAYTGSIYERSGVPLKFYSLNTKNYPLVLTNAPSKGKRGHMIIDYGKVEREDGTYHIIFQSGIYGGIGKRKVTLALVPEEQYLKKYADFRVIDNANERYVRLFDETPVV